MRRSDGFGHILIEDGMQNLLFALEVEVNSAVRDVGGARDVCDLRVEVAIAREDATFAGFAD